MRRWKKTTIGKLGRIVTGKTPSTKNNLLWDGDVPFITPADLQSYKNILQTERTISEEGLNSVKSSVLPAGAICVSCIGNLGYVAMTTRTSVTNQQINSIIPHPDIDNDFTYYVIKSLWKEFKNLEGQSTTLSILNKTLFSQIEEYLFCVLNDEKFFEYIMSGAKGTKMPRGDKRQMMSYRIVMPPLVVLENFAGIIKLLIEHQRGNTLESHRLAALRDTLLPKLMSGEIDVSEVEI